MSKLDRIIHQPVRLQIMAALVALDSEAQLGFTGLRDMLNLSDGNLGAHLRKLEDADYVEVQKTFVARKPQTFVQATPLGRQRFQEHAAALKAILEQE
ncbi:winged helix-turn-helix domain-containing protein [Candidatus Leptofilum sp.]|uniref:winged helix-turn-helix domain-containing protein n=1 Tax=Candidatus Leptofilum sp. TaxID=3241576 RepID=UPI003B5C09E2